MKKFIVKYYELKINENFDQYQELVEVEIDALKFEINHGNIIFTQEGNVNVAAFSDFVSVKRK